MDVYDVECWGPHLGIVSRGMVIGYRVEEDVSRFDSWDQYQRCLLE